MNSYLVGAAAMAALLGAVLGLFVVAAVALTMRLDRARHAEVAQARKTDEPPPPL